MNTLLIFIAGIGFILSLYSYYIEQKVKKDSLYRPVCDLSDRFSCTKPIKSSYGQLIGISNALLGMVYYALVIVLAFVGAQALIFSVTFAGCIVSVYLAWLLYFRIRTVCLICTATYVVNILLLLISSI